jgi:hypothetical protein
VLSCQLQDLADLPLEEDPLIPIEFEVGWYQELLWTFRRRKIFLLLPRIEPRSFERPTRNLVLKQCMWGREQIILSQNRTQWCAYVKKVMNIQDVAKWLQAFLCVLFNDAVGLLHYVGPAIEWILMLSWEKSWRERSRDNRGTCTFAWKKWVKARKSHSVRPVSRPRFEQSVFRTKVYTNL